MTHLLYGNKETQKDWAAIMPMLPSPHVPAGEVWVVSLDGLFAEGSVLGEIIADGPAWRNEMATKADLEARIAELEAERDHPINNGPRWNALRAQLTAQRDRIVALHAELGEAVALLREAIGEIGPPEHATETWGPRVRRLLDGEKTE